MHHQSVDTTVAQPCDSEDIIHSFAWREPLLPETENPLLQRLGSTQSDMSSSLML